ncbi:MAG TPA: cyclic nucleotide-binding domain-containing protein [Chitinophagaceae bacterium]|jgi:CRP-like cAMP-binding protein|nr:cyclic nucleotide-binding domain-containing protein [Chitinophagaceae bacterium]
MKAITEQTDLLLIERVLLLKSLSIFRETPETILAEIAHLLQQEEIEEDTLIMREGDAGNCMYIILQGHIKIHKGDHTLIVLKEKDFFGELSLLDTETRSASATAATDCILYRIDQEPFYDLMEQRPEVARGVIKILCNRLRSANQQISQLSHKQQH